MKIISFSKKYINTVCSFCLKFNSWFARGLIGLKDI